MLVGRWLSSNWKDYLVVIFKEGCAAVHKIHSCMQPSVGFELLICSLNCWRVPECQASNWQQALAIVISIPIGQSMRFSLPEPQMNAHYLVWSGSYAEDIVILQ